MSNVQTSDVRRRMQRKRSRSTSPLLAKRLANTTTAIDGDNKGGSDTHTGS